ncbi:hypothetical protein GM703_00645 [Lactobacillus acetotolerans]|nr:hypothetical protein [Lactobacillus acetotolerans]
MMKQPPIAKVYEALSAIADQRIKIASDHALVTSSNYSKTYTVKFSENRYSSNDNATYWQHYAGYPIIAVLIEQGKLKISENDKNLLTEFKDINWKKLNTHYKNKYDKAINYFLNTVDDKEKIRNLVKEIFDQLMKLDIEVKGNRTKLIKKESK